MSTGQDTNRPGPRGDSNRGRSPKNEGLLLIWNWPAKCIEMQSCIFVFFYFGQTYHQILSQPS